MDEMVQGGAIRNNLCFEIKRFPGIHDCHPVITNRSVDQNDIVGIDIQPFIYLYVALSYDHRVIDGRESVSFLVKVKELIENPYQMLLHGIDPVKTLLGI